MVKIRAVGAVTQATLEAVTPRAAAHVALRKALADGLEMVESIPMDEFTRDVVFRLSDDQWLSYDTT